MSGDYSQERVANLDSQLAKWIFGDRWGLIVFLASVCVLSLFWRVGTFITDTETIVRTLEAVAGGTLQIDTVTGNHFSAPGAVISDGAVYGRNYGQVFLSLPVLWGIELVSRLADLRVGLVALWHLLVLVFVVKIAPLLQQRRSFRLWGSVLVLASFAANLLFATSFSSVSHELLALQLFGILCAGFLGVVLYRLVSLYHRGRVAWLTGLASTLVLPIGFWAQLPKRHVLVSLLVVCILYTFARSRTGDGASRLFGVQTVLLHRALMYAFVGVLAWIHAAVAIFVLLALVIVDLPTAPSNNPRTLVVLALVFGASLIPFLATNGLITGDVLQPPRTLTSASTVDSISSGVLQGNSGGSTGSAGTDAIPGQAIYGKLMWLMSLIISQISGSLGQLGNLNAVLRTWIRSGSLDQLVGGGIPEYRAVNLAVLEVAPIFAGLVAAGILSVVTAPRSALSRLRPIDSLAFALILSFVLLFMQVLPVHVQITVRYLLPIYPIGLFLLARQQPIRVLVTRNAPAFSWSYVAIVLVGSQLLLAYVVAADLTVSEAAQLHAVFGLVAAGILTVSVIASYVWPRIQTLTAASLGLTAGLGTTFLILTGIAYFSFIGQYVLPLSQAVADLIGQI